MITSVNTLFYSAILCTSLFGEPSRRIENTSERLSESQILVVRVEIKKGAVVNFAMSYIDTLFRKNALRLKHFASKDTVFYHVIPLKAATEFSYAVVGKSEGGIKWGTPKLKSFLCLPGDSLKFTSSDYNTIVFDTSSSCLFLNSIYGDRDPLEIRKISLKGKNLSFIWDSLLMIENSFNAKAEVLYKNRQIKHAQYIAFCLLNMYDRYSIFLEASSSQLSAQAIERSVVKRIHDEVIQNFSFKEDIYYQYKNSLIYLIAKIEAKLKGNTSISFCRNFKYLPKLFYAKRITDGVLYNALVNDSLIVTTSQRKEFFNSVKTELYSYESFLSRDTDTKLKFPAGVLKDELVRLDNEIVPFSEVSKSKNKYSLIDLWASWCTPCIAEIPSLKKMEKKFSNKVDFISISVDENKKDWKDAAIRNGLVKQSFLLKDAKSTNFLKFINLSTIPRYILLNPQGEIIEQFFFRPSEKNFELVLSELLSGSKAGN